MAQARARQSCAGGMPRCADLNLSMAPTFTDVWTDPGQRAQDPDITNLGYGDLKTTGSDERDMRGDMDFALPDHHQLRPAHPAPVGSATGSSMRTMDGMQRRRWRGCRHQSTSAPCCHGPVDAAATAQVPAGQLDLTAVPSDEEQLQLRSYRELFFGDNEQEVVGGALQDRLVPGPNDANGNPTMVTVGVGPYLTAGSARGARSAAFLARFAPGSGNTHAELHEPGRASLAVRVAGYWGTVLQQSVRPCRAGQLIGASC